MAKSGRGDSWRELAAELGPELQVKLELERRVDGEAGSGAKSEGEVRISGWRLGMQARRRDEGWGREESDSR